MRGFRKLPKRAFRARLPPNFTERASKTSISCQASATFQGTSFQNEHFVRGLLQISQNELPKRAFRAMLPTIFTEKASKRIISCEASSKFHRRSFQNERFAQNELPKRAFRARQFSQNKLPKRAFRARPPPNFIEQCFQNERFARCFRQFSPKICVSRDRHTDSCERVHPPKAKCASHYSAAHAQISKCTFRYSGVRKNVWIYRPWTDPLRAHKNVTFYYSFGRSTPRFYWEGCRTANEISGSLQFWAIDTTFLLRRLLDGKWN